MESFHRVDADELGGVEGFHCGHTPVSTLSPTPHRVVKVPRRKAMDRTKQKMLNWSIQFLLG